MKNKNQQTNPSKKEKGNVFDKILKENIKQIIKPFAEELLKNVLNLSNRFLPKCKPLSK